VVAVRRNTHKTPTVGRLLLAVAATVAVSAALPAAAFASGEVGVDDVVRAVLLRPELAHRVDALAAGVAAELDARTAPPPPTLHLAHEHLLHGGGGGFEFSAAAERTVDLRPWRRAVRNTASPRSAALHAEADAWRLDAAASVRTAFFAVLHRQARLEAVDAWAAQLAQMLSGLQAREARGDASAFEVLRLRREIDLAAAARAAELAALAEAWAELETWVQWDERPALAGTLAPDAAAVPPRGAAAPRPSLVSLEQTRSALDAESRAWVSPFLRDWAVGGGYRLVHEGNATGHGFLATLSLPLPTRAADTSQRDGVDAARDAVDAELALAAAALDREAAAARARLDGALDALAALPAADGSGELTRLATVAFAAGEASLSELLDAFESDLELQLARYDLAWAARRAAIALDRSLGHGATR
jgi:cobalt-zinc-cadmium efflux system outer membrane protein